MKGGNLINFTEFVTLINFITLIRKFRDLTSTFRKFKHVNGQKLLGYTES